MLTNTNWRGYRLSIVKYAPMKKVAPYSITFVLLIAAVAAAATFSPGAEVARFPAELDEISGMAASRMNTGVLWVHNDSGDGPQVYAVNSKAKLIGTYLLEGTKAVDWEDMSIGPAPTGSYLYVADIGDNNSNRSSVHIYRVAEPQVDANQSPVKVSLKNVSDFEFVYEDGPRDAEAFMVDPLSNDFYVVTKRELTGNRLYRAVAPQAGAMNTLHRAWDVSVYRHNGGQHLRRWYASTDPALFQRERFSASRVEGGKLLGTKGCFDQPARPFKAARHDRSAGSGNTGRSDRVCRRREGFLHHV
jgi:hypothetical protein